jgi:hypothetical protein
MLKLEIIGVEAAKGMVWFASQLQLVYWLVVFLNSQINLWKQRRILFK